MNNVDPLAFVAYDNQFSAVSLSGLPEKSCLISNLRVAGEKCRLQSAVIK